MKITEFRKLIREEVRKILKENESGITIDGKPVKYSSIKLNGVHSWDRPDFADAYADYAEFENGQKLTNAQLDKLTDEYADVINQLANEQ